MSGSWRATPAAQPPSSTRSGPAPEVVTGEPIDRPTVERALVNCDALVQAAAVYSYERRDAKRTLVDTPALARSVLGAALGVGTPHVVDISSTVVFSLDEPRFDEATPLARADRPGWDDPYLQAKVLAELAGRELELTGLPRVTIHPSMTVGPGNDLGPGTSGGLPDPAAAKPDVLPRPDGCGGQREVADAVVAAWMPGPAPTTS